MRGQVLDADDYGNTLAHVISGQLVHIFEQIAAFAYRLTLPVNALRSPDK